VLLPEVRGRRGTSSAGWISIRWSPSRQGDIGKRCRGRLRRLEALADFISAAGHSLRQHQTYMDVVQPGVILLILRHEPTP
jgi:hypothetical protein